MWALNEYWQSTGIYKSHLYAINSFKILSFTNKTYNRVSLKLASKTSYEKSQFQLKQSKKNAQEKTF